MIIVVEADNKDTKLTFFAGYIFQVNVADSRSETTVTILAVLVLEVDAQHGFATLSYGDVTHEHILNQSATTGAGFDADNTVEVWAIHLTVFYIQVAVSAGDFATDDYTAMSFLHITTAYNDVFAGNTPFASVLVTSGLDGNTVISGIEGTVFYQYIFAGFGIAAIAIGTAIINVYTAYGETFAE